MFELPACIWADRIFLVGDFNGWSTDVTPFVQSRDGVWRAAIELPAGRSYQFRYLVDGAWQTDYHGDGWVDNEYSSQNSIVNATLEEDEVIPVDRSGLLPEEFLESGRISRRAVLSPVVQSQKQRYVSSRPIRAAG